MLIDIGVNLSNSRFEEVIDDVLDRAIDAGVKRMVLTGTSVTDSEAVISLSKKYQRKYPNLLYSTVGIHPHEAETLNNDTLARLSELSKDSSVVAIGETGLDFFRNLSDPIAQEKSFEAHIELAIERELPLFLHEREAKKRQLEIINSHINDFPKSVVHCFTGDKKTLFSYLDLDLYIGITGWICDERRGLELQKIVKNIPLNRLMVETDAPYLLPRTMINPPKDRCNEPAFLTHVIESITAHREEPQSEIEQATTATAIEFFNL